MNLLSGALIIVLTTAGGIAAVLAIRSRAPAGGFLHDSDRASAIFGFVGTMFSVLLAFVIFLSLETYLGAKTEAAHESDALLEQYEIAGLFSSGDRDLLQSQLVCYGRSVVSEEWGLMRQDQRSAAVDGWAQAIESTIDGVQVAGPKQDDAFTKFFDETVNREDGRRGRLEEADGVVPSPMWLMLFLGSGCLIMLVLLYGDRNESALVQAAQAGAVTAILVTSLLLVNFLDHPYRSGLGGIQPTSMRFAVETMEHDLTSPQLIPCDANGMPQ